MPRLSTDQSSPPHSFTCQTRPQPLDTMPSTALIQTHLPHHTRQPVVRVWFPFPFPSVQPSLRLPSILPVRLPSNYPSSVFDLAFTRGTASQTSSLPNTSGPIHATLPDQRIRPSVASAPFLPSSTPTRPDPTRGPVSQSDGLSVSPFGFRPRHRPRCHRPEAGTHKAFLLISCFALTRPLICPP
ncbi:uncharacterized protein BKA78DRAFT_77169 [Phyllosticta capitalensis]|uniref:uncharacterized protein n=1 Tax=Phyllosticta capitalensis TaxID=121624 RepID=UPI00312F0101